MKKDFSVNALTLNNFLNFNLHYIVIFIIMNLKFKAQ